jgi:hypothetical protein
VVLANNRCYRRLCYKNGPFVGSGQYEKFYAGTPFIIRGHSFRKAPWATLHGIVDDLMASYDHRGVVR